jgi:pantoate kinase
LQLLDLEVAQMDQPLNSGSTRSGLAVDERFKKFVDFSAPLSLQYHQKQWDFNCKDLTNG